MWGVFTMQNFTFSLSLSPLSLSLSACLCHRLSASVVLKWRSLYKDPYGENIFERSASRPSFSSGVELTAVERDRMKAMSERITELEERLSKYEVRLEHTASCTCQGQR